ncbi:MAG TPA: JAB domain-containing protein, partial [Leptospiraceae bacterium]|nr:JAB domain-containing protein [Leptospiraceae bacterium]
IDLLAKGGLKEVGIRFRDLLKTVLDTGAHHTILCHNHPGDTPEPSEEDWTLFYSVKELFLRLEVDLLDQWIMGRNGIYSCDKKQMIRKMK